jgi:hypothetical protein
MNIETHPENVTTDAECTHPLLRPRFTDGGEQTGEQECAVCGCVVAKAEGPDYNTL